MKGKCPLCGDGIADEVDITFFNHLLEKQPKKDIVVLNQFITLKEISQNLKEIGIGMKYMCKKVLEERHQYIVEKICSLHLHLEKIIGE